MAFIVGTPTKDPDETRLYKMDWSAHLGQETIANSAWAIPAGLTLVANGIVEGNNKTYVTLSGGESGKTYVITNTVYTSNSQIWQRSGRLDVRS